MTVAERRAADIERERRRREALMLLLLLAFYESARRFVGQSVRHGTDPADAVNKVILGRAALDLPGMAPRLANGLAAIHLAGMGMGLTHHAPDLDIPLPAKPDTAERYYLYAVRFATNAAQRLRQVAYEALQRARDEGATIAETVRGVNRAFDEAGITPANTRAVKGEAITLASQAWNSGAFAGWAEPAVWQGILGFEYVTVRDEHVCPICEPRDGLMLGRDDEYWRTSWPTLHVRCRCLMRPLFKPFAAKPYPDAPPPQPGFGARPDTAFGYTFP